MSDQSDIEIQTDLDTLTLFRSHQEKNFNQYKKAVHKLILVIKEVLGRITEYEKLISSKGKIHRPVELYLGFSWYIDRDDIWRFFIGKTSSEFENKTDAEILKLLENNHKELEETFKKCTKEKIAIREELKFLNPRLDGYLPLKEIQDDDKVVKIDYKDLMVVKKKYRNKFFNDFSAWETNKIIKIDIPDKINKHLDKIFHDDIFLFQEFQTYDQDSLESERQGLFQKIDKNINDYILKQNGAVNFDKIDELIQIQLSVLLKSYSSIANPNNTLNNNNIIEKIGYGNLIEIQKDFLHKHQASLGLKKGTTITLKQRKQIEEILKKEYPTVNYNSLMAKLRYDGFAKPQDRNK